MGFLDHGLVNYDTKSAPKIPGLENTKIKAAIFLGASLTYLLLAITFEPEMQFYNAFIFVLF